MTEAQRDALLEILIQTWHRDISADDALELIEDLAQQEALLEILIQTWHRDISADDALELIEDLIGE